MARLLAFVLPLGLDSFAVAAAIGAAGVAARWRVRLRISLIFMIFEAGMPLIGLAAGRGLARVIGPAADYLAAAAVIGLGAWMLFEASRDNEDAPAARLADASGWTAIALGLSISLDELAIGFSLGLARLPVAPVIVAIAILAVVVSQLGLALGQVVSARFREHAEQLASIALIALGGYLIAERAVA